MNNLVGIMQGRLSPPTGDRIQSFPMETWGKEFFYAQEIGLECIDWIVEADKFYENPLITTTGEESIRSLISLTGVQIISVCADYFMDCPFFRCSDSELKERLDVLELLISRLNHYGIKFLEIPFVDNSAIRNKDELLQLIQIIKPYLDKAYKAGVTFAFETSLSPEKFNFLLSALNHPSAMVNYDTGNSASLGYDPKEELEAYGTRVATVHVKDRVLGGGTVPLGQGNARLPVCFSILKAKKYTGPFILQVARGNNEIEWTRNNMAYVKRLQACE